MILNPLLAMVISYPLGIGAQTLVAVVSISFIFYQYFRRGPMADAPKLTVGGEWWPLGLALAFLGWGLVSDFLNPVVNMQWEHPVGYLSWALLPWLVAVLRPRWDESQLKKITTVAAIVVGLWGLVVLSQSIWGWRIAGVSFVSDLTRPRGFYSHPLTLAYASLLLMPLALRWPYMEPRNPRAWVFSLGVGLAIATTYSRSVLAVTAVCLFWNVLTIKTRFRPLLIAICLVGGGLAMVTENPLSLRFHRMLSEKGEDRMSDYPDDRLAFWHAHWEMIKERPFVGHGGPMDTAYRVPYYEKLGLGDFERQYEAHNEYIQVLADKGIIGLVLFFTWLGWLWIQIRHLPEGHARSICSQTFCFFLLACLSQNGFHDSEVRTGVTLFSVAVLIYSGVLREQATLP